MRSCRPSFLTVGTLGSPSRVSQHIGRAKRGGASQDGKPKGGREKVSLQRVKRRFAQADLLLDLGLLAGFLGEGHERELPVDAWTRALSSYWGRRPASLTEPPQRGHAAAGKYEERVRLLLVPPVPCRNTRPRWFECHRGQPSSQAAMTMITSRPEAREGL